MKPTFFAPWRVCACFGASLCALFPSFLVTLAGDYRLEIAARPEDFPPDPQATQRNYLHHQINNRGDILFSAHWRDLNGVRRSAIYAGPPGGMRPVVEGGDPVAEFPGFRFTGGPDRVSLGNFPLVTFNAQGEVWFTGFIYSEDARPGGVLPFSQGFWKASRGEVKLVGATPDFNDNFTFPFGVGNLPYSGQGRPQWSLFSGFRTTDVGPTFFIGDIKAYVRNVGLEFVLNQGLIVHDPTSGMQVITYPGARIPGRNDVLFDSVSLYHVAHKNGNLVLHTTTLEGTNANIGDRKRVFYIRTGSSLVPVYTVNEPLPDLPPLSEVFGTDEPFDLQSNLEGADGTGNFVFNVSASARNRIGGAPMGIWKWDSRANKLVNVFRFREPLPTPGGPVHLDTNVYVRAKIGNNRTVFVAAFTGLGYTRPTTGLFQENVTNFTLLAAAGMVVPGTNSNFLLGNDIGSGLITSAFWPNESNDVLFAASFRTNATLGPSFQGMWAWREGVLHSVIRAGQEMNLGDNTNRIIRAFGYSALDRVFNDLGMFMAIPTFTDGTSAIVRASPEAGEVPKEPCCESGSGAGPQRFVGLHEAGPLDLPADCDLFIFTGKAGDNWHSTGVNPPTSWNDGKGRPHCDAPGIAKVGTAIAQILAFNVTLDQQAVEIGALGMRGNLILSEHLTLNQPSDLDLLFLTSPKSYLSAKATVSMANLLWTAGTIDGSSASRSSFRRMAFPFRPSPNAANDDPVSVTTATAQISNTGRRDLQTRLRILSELLIDTEAELVLGENAELISGERGGTSLFRAGTGKVLFGGEDPGFASIILHKHLRKEGSGAFEIRTRFQASTSAEHPPIQLEIAAGELMLLGGGMFDRAAGTIASDAVLELQGAHNVFDGNFLIGGEGELRMVSLTNSPFSASLFGDLVLSLTNKGATLEGGSVSGQPMGDEGLYNEGNFFWRGGEIGSGGPGRFNFLNTGSLNINKGSEPCFLGENLRNEKIVVQEAALSLTGNATIENESIWRIVDAPTSISGDGKFIQTNTNALFEVEVNGGVTVDSEFFSRGTVLVRRSNPGDSNFIFASLRLNRVANIRNGVLAGGRWRTFEFFDFLSTPNQPIRRVAEATEVAYGGSWPEFRPEENGGSILVRGFLPLPRLINEASATFSVGDNGNVRIQGDLANSGDLKLTGFSQDAHVEVMGDFLNERTTVVDDGAELTVRSTLTSGGTLIIGKISQVSVDGEAILTGLDAPGASAANTVVMDKAKFQVGQNLTVAAGKLELLNEAQVIVGGLLYCRNGQIRMGGKDSGPFKGSLKANRAVFTDQAKLEAAGTIEGDLTIYGLTSPGQSPGLLTITGSLSQTNTSVTVFELAGTGPEQNDQLLIGQSAEIDGTLVLNLINGFRPQPVHQFELLKAGSLIGQFANAPHGSRVPTIDGFGSFLVNYTPTSVLLSDFQSNLDPSPAAQARLLAPTFGFDALGLTLTGSPGRDYILQTSTNLLDWLSLLTNNAAFDGQLSFELPVTADSYRFFRALAP